MTVPPSAGTVPPLAETVRSFDARSPTYDDSRMHRAVAAAAVEAADPQAGQTLLDLAGGTGLVAAAATSHLGGTGRAVVLDASPGMLREARRKGLPVVRGDVHRVPLRDRCVDRVTCVTALHLFSDTVQALREAGRTCRPHGRVVFTTWAADGWSTSRLLRSVAAAHGVDVPDRYAEAGTPDAAAGLARAAGLVAADVRLLRHVEPRQEDGPTTWARVADGSLPAAVRQAFLDGLGDEVEHRLLLVTAAPA